MRSEQSVGQVVQVLGELIEEFVEKVANSAFNIAKHQKKARDQKAERARKPSNSRPFAACSNPCRRAASACLAAV